jgi:branched-chain amino acid transport system permease protein
MTRQVDALQAKPAPLARSRFLSTLDLANIPRRGLILLALLLAVLIAAPAFASDYLLSILILILYFAYTGQAWNVMMGFAGQLSLGHALYVGIGAYTTAALFIHFGTPPWIGLLAAVPIAMATGAVIGFLAFRFRVAGAYFAILTIAFAEFARIGFDHWDWVGASSGLFLPVATYTQNDLWHLRGRPIMFYYLILAMTVLAFLLCRWLLRSRLGYFWQAVREDEEAARAVGIATFRTKMAAVVISAGLTSVAGMFYAFYYNNLFAEQVFSIGRSIEIILGPVIGGVGTLFGPVLGAFLLTGLAESMTEILGLISVDLPGAKQVFYGFCLLLVITLMPEGVWPWLARKLGLEKRR